MLRSVSPAAQLAVFDGERHDRTRRSAAALCRRCRYLHVAPTSARCASPINGCRAGHNCASCSDGACLQFDTAGQRHRYGETWRPVHCAPRADTSCKSVLALYCRDWLEAMSVSLRLRRHHQNTSTYLHAPIAFSRRFRQSAWPCPRCASTSQ
jgi:hypothetical protein